MIIVGHIFFSVMQYALKIDFAFKSQVCMLLDSIGLPQYKAIVTTERVSGSILSHLTEDDLRDELKITSRLHRLRLMEVINGRCAAQ